ncbi:hypothetical protein [Veronia pacifica]|uniref:Uncharacterized protein n=1 Tax=Veronia pacifica TaxID=1080227 RepID=A0A1C3EMP5_9GAMM|nr:hypothetical protein [Veronia pacifica]ODA34517.1 hypothetical protein A8L45_05985 [Veronia pacifica]
MSTPPIYNVNKTGLKVGNVDATKDSDEDSTPTDSQDECDENTPSSKISEILEKYSNYLALVTSLSGETYINELAVNSDTRVVGIHLVNHESLSKKLTRYFRKRGRKLSSYPELASTQVVNAEKALEHQQLLIRMTPSGGKSIQCVRGNVIEKDDFIEGGQYFSWYSEQPQWMKNWLIDNDFVANEEHEGHVKDLKRVQTDSKTHTQPAANVSDGEQLDTVKNTEKKDSPPASRQTPSVKELTERLNRLRCMLSYPDSSTQSAFQKPKKDTK